MDWLDRVAQALGVGGFLLGAASTWMQFRDRRAHLGIWVDQDYSGLLTTDMEYRPDGVGGRAIAKGPVHTIAILRLDATNTARSATEIKAVTVTARQPKRPLRMLRRDEVGPWLQAIFRDRPAQRVDHWQSALRSRLEPSQSEVAFLMYEVGGEPLAHGQTMSVRIAITDSHGRTHKKRSVTLRRLTRSAEPGDPHSGP